MKENKSSGIIVDDGKQYRLYTMHPEVCLHTSIAKGAETTNITGE